MDTFDDASETAVAIPVFSMCKGFFEPAIRQLFNQTGEVFSIRPDSFEQFLQSSCDRMGGQSKLYLSWASSGPNELS